MEHRKYLMSLDWNTFSRYPKQGSSIYLHCHTENGSVHKFLRIDNFNAVLFDTGQITRSLAQNRRWHFSWLPAEVARSDERSLKHKK